MNYRYLLVLLAFTLFGCDVGGEVIYSPPYIPISISLDTDGKVSIEASTPGIKTNFGTIEFATNASSEISYLRGDSSYKDLRMLFVRVDNEVSVFELEDGNEFRIEFRNEDVPYQQVRLTYEQDGDIILELESIDASQLITAPINRPTPPTPTKTQRPPTPTIKVPTSTSVPPTKTPFPPTPIPVRQPSIQGHIVFQVEKPSWNIYSLSLIDGSISQLTDYGAFDPVLSPNGGRIAFSSWTGGDSSAEIHVSDIYGANVTRLTFNNYTDVTPAWSPDGSKIVFAADSSQGDFNWAIFVMNSDGTNLTRLTDNPAGGERPVWSPNGLKIAFTSGQDGPIDLYVFEVDGNKINLRRITNGVGWVVGFPSWSPTSEYIAFSDRDKGIYSVNTFNNNLQKLADFGEYPTWSPDGSKVAFSSKDNSSEIYTIDSNGSNLRQLTNNSYKDSCPKWSPDGKFMVFWSDRNGTGQLYLMDSNGNNQKPLISSFQLDVSQFDCPFDWK